MASEDPWSLYWQGGNLHSCIASQGEQDQAQIDRFWAEFALSLAPEAHLLDLASGNGAVPRALMTANSSLSITAVDLADIAPDTLIKSFPELSNVQFFPGTDVCDLPFEAARFDGVTSQFGLEYAPHAAALREAQRVLKVGAPMRLLLHHIDSGIVRPAQAVITEIEALACPGGLIESLREFVGGRCDLDNLELVGQRYLNGPTVKSRHISGQVITGISRVIDDLHSFPDRAAALASGMEQRLTAEAGRLSQLRRAALDTEGASGLKLAATEAGFGNVSIDEVFVGEKDPVIVGWRLSAVNL
ncbi:MAG: class I SAM-dependent methyltransferase [Halioglobus sp.]